MDTTERVHTALLAMGSFRRDERFPCMSLDIQRIARRTRPNHNRQTYQSCIVAVMIIRLAIALAIVLAASCHQKHLLEVHRADYENQPGFTVVEDRYGTTFYMAREIELSESDVQQVEFVPDENGLPRIKLLFNPNGAAKFRALTQVHLNRPLVFLVRGKVAMVPLVSSVATDDFTWIEGNVTDEDAKLLMAATK